LLLAGACTAGNDVEMAEVSGKVLLRGEPLRGGRVTFVTAEGAFASGGAIDENGNYKINAPVGEVQISVDNRHLQPQGKVKHPVPQLKRPESEPPTTAKGRYRAIPSKYYAPETSGLTYKVQSGPQTHDIALQ
jgi:hypothetical protein